VPATRSLLARVQRLEQERSPVRSPFVLGWGSFEAFAAECEADMGAGKLDRLDFPGVLESLRRWDVTWGAWRGHGLARPSR
jgi:hypothetical protein